MRVKSNFKLSNLEFEDLRRILSQWVEDVTDIINGHVGFSDNIDVKIVSATFSGANANTAVSHDLGRVPAGYIVVGSSANMVVFNGSGTNTASVLYLKSSAAGTASLMLF